MDQYLVERAALESKFLNLCSPLYVQRREIIAGLHDETIASEAPKAEENAEDEKAEEEEEEEEEVPKGVPDFWVTAMSNIDPISELITEADFECLSALYDIQCNDFEDGKGFTLEFHFKENDFFTEKVLTKRYEIPNLLLADEPILKKVEGCEINWKDGKCLTYTEVSKKQRSKSGKKAGQVKTITTKEETPSFFHFFRFVVSCFCLHRISRLIRSYQ
jgi:nucleosome assembly protein 1-like 1